MIAALVDFGQAFQRQFDLIVLWPECKKAAREAAQELGFKRTPEEMLEQAKACFAIHAFRAPEWLALGEDEIRRRIDGLR